MSPTGARAPRDLPPLWLMAGILAMLGLHYGAPVAVLLQRPWTLLGWPVQALAIALMLHSLRGFLRARTGLRPLSPVSQLVVVGAYRWTRNPMYLGLVGVTAGIGLCLGTLSPWIVPPALFLLLDRRFVRREERFLHACLGPAYDAYRARVRRWL